MKPLTIVGGGLAGLTLGIGLRRESIPVTIWEAGQYPRHRVCGEFISGRGQQVLTRLGLAQQLIRQGARVASTAMFCLQSAGSPVRALTSPALCLSRFVLDSALAQVFRELGGKLLEGQRADLQSNDGVVYANGRRKVASKTWQWFGLKAHATGVQLVADLEMHSVQNGYVGLCQLPGEKVNVCGLFRKRFHSGEQIPAWQTLLRGSPESLLRRRLEHCRFDEGSYRAVAGLSLKPASASESLRCVLGDALTMIPPVTGNGMSLAFESAEIAIDPLAAYSRGQMSWSKARQTIALKCDEQFAARLAWAKWLHWMMFSSVFQGALGQRSLNSAWLWQLFFARTR